MKRTKGAVGGLPEPVWILDGADPGVEASREGRGVCKGINEVTPGAAQVVLTDPAIAYTLVPGERVMVSYYCYAVETASDNCQFEFGYIDESGVFRPIGPHKHVYTGASNSGRTSYDQEIYPAGNFSYANGVRVITFRVDANDASCQVTVGWHGWTESET